MKKKKLRKIAPILNQISFMEKAFGLPYDYLKNFEDDFFSTWDGLQLPKETKKSPFEIPKNYFEKFDTEFEHIVSTEQIEIPNHNKVPIGYFDQLEDSVLRKIEKQKRSSRIRKLTMRIATPLAIAASLALIFILNTKQSPITFESLASTEIEDFIDAGAIDIDINTLALAFPNLDLDTNSMFEDFSDDEVLDYLYNENLGDYYYDN